MAKQRCLSHQHICLNSLGSHSPFNSTSISHLIINYSSHKSWSILFIYYPKRPYVIILPQDGLPCTTAHLAIRSCLSAG